MSMRAFFLIIHLAIAALSSHAQVSPTDTLAVVQQEDNGRTGHENHCWSWELGGGPARVLALDKYVERWLKGRSVTAFYLQANHTAALGKGEDFDADYNYPSLSFGLKVNLNHATTMHREANPAWGQLQPVDYTSRLGNALTLYGRFERPVVRAKRWEWGYYLGLGAGYFHQKYNLTDDIDNELIGSHLNIYFTAGLYGQYWLAKTWAVKAGVDFSHHSNGALYRPNKGANYLGPFAALVYSPQREQPEQPDRSLSILPKSSFRPYWLVEATLGLGAKTLLEDWQRTQFNTPPGSPDYRTDRFPIYGAFSFEGSLLYRYARRWASGIGLDVFYGDYAHKVARLDRAAGYADEPHSPWSVGLAARHEVYYGRLSARMGVGWYLYRHMGVGARKAEKRYYERIGLFYELPHLGGTAVGISVNAHATKADFTELVVSVPLLRFGNK